MAINDDVQFLVALLAAMAIGWNAYALAYAWKSRPLKSQLAKDRPFTKGAVQTVVWIVACTVIAVVCITGVTMLRNYYTLDFLVHDAPWYVITLIIVQYMLVYGYAVLPGTFLYFLVWALKERDRLIETRLRAYDEIPKRYRRRSRGTH